MALWTLVLAMIAPAGAGAVVARDGDGTLESLAFVSERLSPRSDVDLIQESQARPEVRQAVAGFRTDAGGEWTAFVDRRTGLVEAVAGSGIPWIPGRGNQLTMDDISASLKEGAEVDLAALESIARGFLPRVAPMLGVKPAQLVLSKERSRQITDYLWRVDFDVVRGGLPVEGAYVAFTVNHGNLIQIEAESIPSPGSSVPKAEVKRQQALSILSRFLGGFSAADTFLDGGSMHLLPVAEADASQPDGFARSRGILPAWQFTFVREGSAATWRARVDAVKGELLELVDINDYANAYVRGGAMFLGTQASRPMPYANWPVSFTNSSGVYIYPGAATNSTLSGQYVRALDNCGAINEPSGVSGDIDFGLSPANNCSTPGHGGAGNTRSSRTQFYHLNRAKDTARGWYPANAWVNAQLTANVNINSTCNAFWNGVTVNFYRSGGGCGNTGEIEAVSLHEYGHGFDTNDGNGTSLDKGTGETYGDFTAALVTHSSCIGAGFRTTNCGGYGDPCLSCTGVRDIDWGAHLSNTPHTVANFIQTNCPASGTYQGPCGREGHCESYVSSEAVWDLAARDLPSPGSAQAWSTADRLWYLSRPTANKGFVCVTSTPVWSSHGCAAGTNWRAMRAVDDDNGNLTDGTPNSGALYAAFNRHLIACTTDAGANTTYAGCTPPATPTVTLTPGDDQVTVSWTAAVGAVYDVFRNDLGCGYGMAKVANNVAGSSFVDTKVANDVAYSYLVVAHGTGNEACAAQASACQDVTPRHRTDVYTKDKALPVPEDTGVEPEVPLFPYPMWQSPDIWVRTPTNTAGPHQNPEFGQPNFVKVMVRNRSTVTALNVPVKVYYANASAGLAWPIDWTLIDTAIVPSLAGGADTEITVTWNPPGTGHYCLLSRIDTPQDPMTFAETVNVDYNTRYNNNIAWRNVNVVNLVPFAAVKAEFIGRNPFREDRFIRLVIRETKRDDGGRPFLDRGTVRIVLTEKIVALMEEQGIEPRGLKRIDQLTFELADPDGGFIELKLAGRDEFPVGMQFEDREWTPPTEESLDDVPTTTYTIEAVEQDVETGEEIGGVAYLVSVRAH